MTSSDSTVMQMRSGTALLKFGTSGLLQSHDGGSKFYRANPLYRAFKLVYKAASASGYECSMIYPSGLSTPTATRNSAGNITITHNYALSTYYPQGAYVCTGGSEYSRTIMFDDITANSLRVHLKIGNNSYDPQNTGEVDYCVIYLYDFKLY